MAATRAVAVAVASNTTTASATCMLFKKPFLSKQSTLCFKNLKPASSLVSKRLFTCRAIYNPEVQIKEEGQPETLDYRVFFVGNSGKKVPFNILFGSRENGGENEREVGVLNLLKLLILITVHILNYYYLMHCFVVYSYLPNLCLEHWCAISFTVLSEHIFKKKKN